MNKWYLFLAVSTLYCSHLYARQPSQKTINNIIQFEFISNFHAAMSNSPRYIQKNAELDVYWSGIIKLYDTYVVNDLQYQDTPRIPKIIHQIWIGNDTLPEKYHYFQNTWIQHHPDWQYILWTEKEIEAFCLMNRVAYDASNNYGQKSDIARYEILYRMGGLYVDTDFECLKNFDILHHCFDFYTGSGFGPLFHAYIGIIASAPGHIILKQCIDHINIHAVHNNDPMLNILYTTGPYLFANCIKNLLGNSALGRSVIFPVNYFYPLPNLLDNVTYEQTRDWIRPETFAMHHWHVSWNNGISPGKKNRKVAPHTHKRRGSL
jgi:mannosyltransferase OCH1-like enzyme